MGRPTIILSEKNKQLIKELVEQYAVFNALYEEVQKLGCEMSKGTLRKILKDMKIDKFVRKDHSKFKEAETSFFSDDNTEGKMVLNPNYVYNSRTTEVNHSKEDESNDKKNENLSQEPQENICTESTSLDIKNTNENKSNSKDQNDKENIDASQDDHINAPDETLPSDKKRSNEEERTSTEDNTEHNPDAKFSSTPQITTESFESLSKKIDIISNDIMYLLKQIDIIKAAILPLTEKNPNKTISLLKDDFIKIYADQRASTTINLNMELKEPIRALANKLAGTKNFSDAVNLALLIALYSEYGEDIR